MELCDVSLERYMSGTKTEICGLLDWNQTSETRPRSSVICEIMQHILDSLKFIHDKGEVPRDLTPPNGNLFNVCNFAETVLYSSASHKWKLADFGLTSTVLATHNTTTARRGKDGYRAPEVWRHPGRYNQKVDI